MSTKNLKTRILMKRDSEINWLKAENFIPLPGEIIVYTADDAHEKPRIKIGDGETKVSDLPFATLGIPDIPQTQLIYEETLTMEYMTNTWITSGLIPLVVGNKYQVTIEDKTFSSVAVMEQWDSENSIAVLGNANLFYPDREGTGEPYCILAAFNPIDVGGASLLGAVVIDGTVWSNKESVYLKIEEGSPNHLMLTTNENGEIVWEEKTHYEYTCDVVPETEYSIADLMEEVEGFPVVTSSDIIEGNDYIVTYNGVEYKIKCKKIESNYTFLVLGNLFIFGEEDNGLPFLFLFPVDSSLFPDNIQGSFSPIDQFMEENVDPSQIKGTYSIKELTVKKLDPKFIDTSALEPDWNANEGEVGYIKNRTHGIGKYVEYFPEMEVQLIEGDDYPIPYYKMTVPMSTIEWIEFGKLFTITYNGVDYNCEFIQEGASVATGNLKVIEGPIGNNEPFILIGEFIDYDNVGIALLSLDKSAGDTVTLKISNNMNRVMKLDKKFLPDGLFYMESEIGGTVIAKCDSIYDSIDGGDTPLLYPLEEGRKYTININGELFHSTCKTSSFSLGNLVINAFYLGNLSIFYPSLPNSGETYVFIVGSHMDENTLGYTFSNYGDLGGKSFTITTATSYSKIPSQHLPTPNWSAKKGEEGYIENRTHWYFPGFTAEWDNVTEGKETCTLQDGSLGYKILDTYITNYNPEQKIKVTQSNGNTSQLVPMFKTENQKNLIIGNLFCFLISCADTGDLTFVQVGENVTNNLTISVPSSGTYIFTVISQSMSFVEEGTLKTLDPIYIDKSAFGSVTIVSSDYEALMSGGERIENPTYHMNFTEEEFVQLLKNKRVGDIRLYYTYSTEDDSGEVLFVKDLINHVTNYEDGLIGFTLSTHANFSGMYAKIHKEPNSEDLVVTWLNAEDTTSSIELDTTLKVSGKAADAKAVGDAIREAAFSGDYNDLTNKPTIPSVEGLATESYVDSAVANKADRTEVPTHLVNGTFEGSLRSTTACPEGNGYFMNVGAFAVGSGTKASGNNSFAAGYFSKATGIYASAMGYHVLAEGNYSNAEGFQSKALGTSAHAEGRTIASGDYAHSEGRDGGYFIYLTGEANSTTYTYEHQHPTDTPLQVGMFIWVQNCPEIATITQIDESAQTILVSTTLSSEAISRAPSTYSYGGAKGNYSHIEGEGTYAGSAHQHVQGKYNSFDDEGKYAHIVGGGSAYTYRRNIHTLDWNGRAWFKGGVYVGGGGQDDETAKKLVTQSELQSELNTPRTSIILSDTVTGQAYNLYIANGELKIKEVEA